ncbi:unnamed protein product, partial [Phaeothamnion confervicola]
QIQEAARLRRLRKEAVAEAGRDLRWAEWASAVGLTPDALSSRLAAGDAAKNTMVVCNLGLVRHVVGSYMASSSRRGGATCRFMPQDLIQDASLGLIRAAEKFDPARGVKFASYASWWIRSALSKTLQQQHRIIRVPQEVADELSRCKRVRAELSAGLQRPATDAEVAGAAGVTVEKLVMYRRISSGVLSLDARPPSEHDNFGASSSSGGGSGGARGRGGGGGAGGDSSGFVSDAALADADALSGGGGGGWGWALRVDLSAMLHFCLDPAERAMIHLRYGLDDGRPRSLAECAEELGVTKDEAQAMSRAALAKLRKNYSVGENLFEYSLA